MPQISYDQPLSRCPEEQLGIRVPVPLNREIDALCKSAEDTGDPGTVDKKEMVAAILFAATSKQSRGSKQLVSLLQAYRKAKAESRMPKPKAGQKHYDYEALRPGRRKKRAD